jgi:hypothetical protein
MRRWPLADRYDGVAIGVLIAVILVGAVMTGRWLAFPAIRAAVGNLSAYILRRRAGIPDRSLYGRIRGRRGRLH